MTDGGEQLGLFGAEPARSGGPGVRPAVPSPELAELARRLPTALYMGTSSWSFPGWQGLVWSDQGRPPTKQRLARAGLAAYAHHPLFRAVGLDRTYYGPLPRGVFERYAADVPAGFRFVVKAHDALLGPTSARFLDVEHAAAEVVAPCVEGLGEKAGPLVFQFPPLDVASLGGVEGFIERLHRFLGALPRGPLYAVELRNRELACREAYAAFEDAGAVPCFNVHPRTPPLAEQLARHGRPLPRAVVVRWMLHRSFHYEAARTRYAPFDRLVDPDPGSRAAVAELTLEAVRQGRPVFVIANNKAEGSAPLTLEALARHLAPEGGTFLPNSPR